VALGALSRLGAARRRLTPTMRLVTLALIALLALVHAELWFGRGGMGRVIGLQGQLQVQQAKNAQAQQRNDQLTAEVRDLKEGLEMVEEKARGELGMVKPDEILVQFTTQPRP
jgi:cell division protein FtsB